MALKESLLDLAKRLVSRPSRAPIRDLLLKLNSSTREAMEGQGPDRSSFGYVARQRRDQFFGYLFVDSNLQRIKEVAGPIPLLPLQDDERRIMRNAHAEILRLNRACVEKVTSAMPYLARSLSPYEASSALDAPCESGAELFAEEDILAISVEFNESSCIQRLKRRPTIITQNVPELKIFEVVNQIDQRILTSGVDAVPQDLMQFLMGPKPKDPTTPFLAFILNLIAARQMIMAIDQVVYQAAFKDRMAALTDDNVIDLRISSNIISRSLEIDCQPIGEELYSGVGEFVLVKGTAAHLEKDVICRIEGETISFSQDFGTTMRFRLRQVDDEMNPYFEMLRHID